MLDNPFLFLALIAAAALGIRLLIEVLNHNRIKAYLAGQGAQTLSITWHPFGTGWFGEKDSVIYRVRYRDREGSTHDAVCKTGLFSGVFFSNDIIINRAHRPVKSTAAVQPTVTATSNLAALQQENNRLRDEIAMLREELDRLRADRHSPREMADQ